MKALRLVGLLVLFLGLSVFSAPCQAKPVQLLDYDAQTFFENYKLAAKNFSPKLLPFIDDSLTYEGETSLYRKYKFRVNNKVSVTLYENRGGCVSFLEIESDTVPESKKDENDPEFVLAGIWVNGTLDLKDDERKNLLKGKKQSETYEARSFVRTFSNYSTYSRVNKRYIHNTLEVCGFKTKGNWYNYMLSTYSADDEE